MQRTIKKPKPVDVPPPEPAYQGMEIVPREVALVFEAMKKSTYFKNPRYIAEINYAIPSSQKRFFIYDREKKVLYKHKAAHGVGGKNKTPNDGRCREVSNKNGSHMSCLGLFKCSETYNGNNGYSMRIDGLESTNGNARMRAIVVHGSDYVNDDNTAISGRSFGCPAVTFKHYKAIIDMLKNGSPLLSHYNGANKI